MSVVSLMDVKVLNNPAPFTSPYEFEITFECLEQLQKDLEWKLTYVGSATSSEHDQELDSLLVGPIPVGVNKFIFEADPPDLKRIPTSDILGVTVILLTCSYDGREFVRAGYYVNNEYDSDDLNAEPPAKPIVARVRRNILAAKPRVTRFNIKWDSEESAPAEFPPEQPEADLVEDDGTAYGAEEEDEEEEVLEEVEAEAAEGDKAVGEDAVMAGADDTAGPSSAAPAKADDENSEAGSEDLEAESSGSEEEEIEEEEEEGDGDEDMEMGDDGADRPANGATEEGQALAQDHKEAVMAL